MLTTLATVGLIAGMAAAGGQIAGGMAANRAANRTADQEEQQAKIALEEANRQADLKKNEQRRFLAEQRMAYLANGVSLIGTPGIVQGDTFDEFQQEIEALRKSGVAQYGFAMHEAANTRASGRAQLISGIMEGVGTAGTAAFSASKSTGGLSKQSKTLGFDTRAYR